jgi:hypothetical protein
MILPGLISIAFYRKRPTPVQIALGLVATIALSAALGYISPGGPLGQLGSVIVAIIGGVAIYFVILWYLISVYQPKHAASAAPNSPTSPP